MTVPNLGLIILLLIFLQSIPELKGGLRRDNALLMNYYCNDNSLTGEALLGLQICHRK
jgi:hypothetical protein